MLVGSFMMSGSSSSSSSSERKNNNYKDIIVCTFVFLPLVDLHMWW